MDTAQAQGELGELERQIIALGNLVENLFAESVMSIIEQRDLAGISLRAEDCRAHERVIEIDHLCLDLLGRGGLPGEQVRFAWSCGRIATDLKRTADESLRLAQGAHRANLEDLPDAVNLQPLARMVALVQNMLGDCIEAFINRDTAEAAGLHVAFRSLTELRSETVSMFRKHVQNDLVPLDSAFELMNIAGRLETTGEQILDIGNLISHLRSD